MKKLLVLALALPLLAQSLSMTANIPFNFVIGKSTMPANNYIISDIDKSGTLYFHNSSTGIFTGTNAGASVKKGDSFLVFKFYKSDGSYHLVELQYGVTGKDYVVPVPKEFTQLTDNTAIIAMR